MTRAEKFALGEGLRPAKSLVGQPAVQKEYQRVSGGGGGGKKSRRTENIHLCALSGGEETVGNVREGLSVNRRKPSLPGEAIAREK